MPEENKTELIQFTKETVIEYAKQRFNNVIITIHGNVYDVTLFIEDHPGGENVIKNYQIRNQFKDATKVFEDFGHSRSAIFMLKKYLIGTLNVDEDKQHQQQDQIYISEKLKLKEKKRKFFCLF